MEQSLNAVRPADVDCATDDDEDDLWNFGSPTPSPPQQEATSAICLSDDEDELKSLPAHKRRKLQQLASLNLSDSEKRRSGMKSGGSDSDLEVMEASKAEPKKPDELDLMLQQPKAFHRKVSAENYETQMALLRNKRVLEQFRAQLDAPMPESPVLDDDESPVRAPSPTPAFRDSEGEAAEDGQEKIVVKLRCKSSSEPMKLRIGTKAPLDRLFAAFRQHAEAKGWIQSATELRFVFDGDSLAPTETAESLDIEDDTIIEAHW